MCFALKNVFEKKMLLFSCALLLSVISKIKKGERERAKLCECLLCSVVCRLLEEFANVCKV